MAAELSNRPSDGRDRARRRTLWALLVTSHLLAAAFSRGYLQMDEHFQVLEYIQWKLGSIGTDEMPWELAAKMRPWLHILIFFPLEWTARHVVALSPFTRTMLHRACVAALSLFVIRRLTQRHPERLLLYASLFFLPLFDVRLSSEVIGGWLFALAFVLDDETSVAARGNAACVLGIGFLFGLAVVIRLLVLAMLGGLVLFHLQRRDFRRIGWLGLGFACALAFGALCDRWGYGVFTCVPWNYVNQNVVLGKAVQFGAAPWYWYIPTLLEKSGYVPGAVLLIALFWHWARKPLDKLSFVSLPFALVHACVAHKELRFLFPLAPLMPAIMLTLWRDLERFALAPYLARAFVALNLTLMLPAVLHDANPYVGLYAALLEQAPPRDSVLHYKNNTNPLRPWGLRPSYYLESLALDARPLPQTRKRWRGLVMVDELADYVQLRDEDRCRLLASRYPSRVLDAWPAWLPTRGGPWMKLWSLWSCP